MKCVDFSIKLCFYFLSKMFEESELSITLIKLSCRPQLNVQVLFTTMRMWFKPDFRRYCCDLLLCSYREYESDLRSNEHYLSSSEIYDFHIFTVIYVHTILSYYLFRGK